MTNTGTQIACNNRAEAIAALEALHERSSSTNLYKDGPLILSNVPKQCIEGEVVLGKDVN